MRRKQQKYRANITVNGAELPVDVVFEYRNGVRFGITRKRIIMRLPHGLAAPEVQKQLGELEKWVSKVSAQKKSLLTPFTPKQYASGDILAVGKREYILDITEEDRGSHSGELVGNTIALRLSERSTETHRVKAIKTLLSRIVAADFLPEIERRVHYWNNRTFQQPVSGVYLKYNHSNWGSCSVKGNVNLSTRLLFAPEDVQDYVILHELAHRVEMNHSDRFWALIERYMPDYRLKEKWLKQHGGECDF